MQGWFYLPFMHDEGLVGQIAGRGLWEGLKGRWEEDSGGEGGEEGKREGTEMARQGLVMAQKHLDVVRRFGRFPARNKALGRVSTPAEEEFLRENPVGF